MLKSWQTSLMGIFMIVIAVLTGGMDLLQGNALEWTVLLAEVAAGIGFLRARDNGVSSEDAGAN